MSTREGAVLVPGLFGFAHIGEVEYFATVKALLAGGAVAESDIVELETLPTGSLWRRVDRLCTRVREVLATGVERVHLIGHSTGGVDVRLFTNVAYVWPGGPTPEERLWLLDKIGTVISISAPHKGTPIAVRLRGALENSIPFLFLLSILAKARADESAHLGGREWAAYLYACAKRGGFHHAEIKTALEIAGTSPEVAKAADDYLDLIVDDHPLIHELTPKSMKELNDRIAGGARKDIYNFVTVSPPVVSFLGMPIPRTTATALHRLIYAFSYESTTLRPKEFGDFPGGRWILDRQPPSLADFALRAQDGVVPAASQHLETDPRHSVAGLVYGDHLDVVGHYRGVHGGETVFDSGAAFDGPRMEALWCKVRALIGKEGMAIAA